MNSLHNLLIPISRQITWRQFSCCGWHGTQLTTKPLRQPQLSFSNYSYGNNSIWVCEHTCVYECRNADLCLSLIINGEEGLQRRRLIYRKLQQMMKAHTGRETGLRFLCSNSSNFFPGFTMLQRGNTFHWGTPMNTLKRMFAYQARVVQTFKRECAFICKCTVWTGYTNVAIEPTTFL